MSTRGAVGVTYKGKDYIAYNHSDSYPSGLGANVLEQIPLIMDMALEIPCMLLVDQNTKPTDAQIEKYKLGDEVREQAGTWYDILRSIQGDLPAYISFGVFPQSAEFLLDSLFCEWAYIVNLDTNMLECYRGYRKEPVPGRFAEYPPNEDGYYPVGLIKQYPLGELPDSDTLEADLNKEW